MFHHPCFTALIPLAYQALLPANFEMNAVVSLTDVVTSSSSEETVWTGLPGPWVDLSTFLKLALVLLSVLIWQLAFSPFMYFPLSQTCSPMPTAATMLALCASLFHSSGLQALPTMTTLLSRSQIRMRSRRIFSQCACVFLRFNTHAQSQIFHNTHAYSTVAWLWPAFIHARGSTPARLKLKVLVAMDVLGFARGLTSSDALICCQDHAVILMADKNHFCMRSHSKLMTNRSSELSAVLYCHKLPSMTLSGSITIPSQQYYFCFSLADDILHWVCSTRCTE